MAPIRAVVAAVGLLLGALPSAFSGCCPNACSGHGTCTVDDACVCYSNWQNGEENSETGDCADRSCPYEIAWVDTPDESGLHHTYAECANKGICDRTTGECLCFEGYEGKACQRMTCPNDCSGHGRCVYTNDAAHGVNLGSFYSDQGNSTNHKGELGDTNGNDAVMFDYYGWDEDKTRVCTCDPGYEGVDCSYRSCAQGNDVMVERLNRAASVAYQKQAICLYAPGSLYQGQAVTSTNFAGNTFALSFTSMLGERFTTVPIPLNVANTNAVTATYIKNALEGLPNGVIDQVSVSVGVNTNGTSIFGSSVEDHNCDYLLAVTFDGTSVQGDQNLLEVEWRGCGDGCTPKVDGLALSTVETPWSFKSYVMEVQDADYESYVCGGRGKCDYTTGQCSCFTGYYGLHCQTQTALI